MSNSPGLYVHVPFCSAICPYCDFAVTTGNETRRARFVEHLLTELELDTSVRPERFDTLYLGGGTPSMLSSDALERVLDASFLADHGRRFLEANPEDVTDVAAKRWVGLGFHTLSLGVQAFGDAALDFLGRRHTGAEARAAVDTAKRAGFDAISIDLIFGLPGQSVEDWRRELERAVACDPEHVSCYQLTIHEETAFGRRVRDGKLAPASDAQQADLFFESFRFLEDHGYVGYEVSNFSKGDRYRSQHNEKYWSHVPYVGVGPSAHSFDGRTRRWNHRSTKDWEQSLGEGRAPVDGWETLSEADLLLETVALRLRTRDGLDVAAVEERFGVDLVAANSGLVERLEAEGLMTRCGDRLCPTIRGLAVADGVAASFQLPEPRCQTPR